jgi:hypothetical protein
MTSSRAAAPPTAQKRQSRQAGLRQASLAILIVLIVQFTLGISVTSAAGLVAIGLAFFFGASFTSKLTNGYSLGMAIAFAVALACYAVGLYAASTRRGGP